MKELLLQLARHIRNTDKLNAIQWGNASMELLEEVQALLPEEYEQQVKSQKESIHHIFCNNQNGSIGSKGCICTVIPKSEKTQFEKAFEIIKSENPDIKQLKQIFNL